MSNEFSLSPENKVFSTVSKHIFDHDTPSSTDYLDCHSPVIYLVTYTGCSLQYIEETGQKINERFN